MPSGGDNKDPDRGYNFVSVDPSAPGEKADSRSLIRANAGRYIWEQRRQTTTSSKARSKKGNVDRSSKQQGNSSRSLPTRLPNRHREAAVACSVGNGQTVLTPPPDDDDPHPVDMIFDESSMTLLKKEPDEEEEQRTNLMAIDNVHQDSHALALDAGVSSLFASYPSDLDERAARRLIHYAAEQLLPSLIPILPDGGGKDRKSEFWLPLAVNHPALFSSIMYGTATHEKGRKRLERPNSPALEKKERLQIMIVEDEAIRRLNAIISDPSQALTDEIILAIMTVAFSRYENTTIPPTWRAHLSPLRRLQWLDVYCSLDLDQVHILGLLQVIHLKGGLHKIKMEGLAETLSFAGAMLATRSLSKPVLPYVALAKTNKGSIQPDWPLNVLAQISAYGPARDFKQYVRTGLTGELAEILQDIHTYSIVIDLFDKGKLHYPGDHIMADRRNYIQHRLMSLPSLAECAHNALFVETHRVYEPCRLATMIYSLLTVFPVPPVNAPLAQLGRLVRIALTESDPQKSWHAAPDLLRWAFVLGAIASGVESTTADDREVRAWYIRSLRRLAPVFQIRSWNDLKRSMKKVLWLDCLCDPYGKELWNEIVSSTI
ncbi:hypothetical protein DTO164E3_6807 [Paecilomyces variotii]|uniref:Uncharacterized protein n=1 Tax=Byssochlamys spectabilis TaxID=264951 RepID=A0A443HZE3_BYSSP|nr:hypothetical protein C8Q69DRAFT_219288 [Paecilomyces variotii]KAJ9195494.1 hypothetical protein DTO164E3_6807 [Paecilomyces variotii]KAJ9207470.1 hypothetical protein DTO032I3_1114 [Paecilomyces variotii]KAJ9230154.1 hypothetical protein DTO169E5_8562 [Paecilomyces variotii]KAJ9275611.1 hypothetical protein DTO021D3_7549 [Paecilomyces variotii]KAJ9284234.1 hypothetical protein DTO021C3_8205 [Paecilomyces variotii]